LFRFNHKRFFREAMLVARAGFRVSEIGRAVEKEGRRSGFSVIRELGGHGIGRTIQEELRVSKSLLILKLNTFGTKAG
jgi:methionine aminopeptidase